MTSTKTDQILGACHLLPRDPEGFDRIIPDWKQRLVYQGLDHETRAEIGAAYAQRGEDFARVLLLEYLFDRRYRDLAAGL